MSTDAQRISRRRTGLRRHRDDPTFLSRIGKLGGQATAAAWKANPLLTFDELMKIPAERARIQRLRRRYERGPAGSASPSR